MRTIKQYPHHPTDSIVELDSVWTRTAHVLNAKELNRLLAKKSTTTRLSDSVVPKRIHDSVLRRGSAKRPLRRVRADAGMTSDSGRLEPSTSVKAS
ncbi:hypothetical protein GUJ93_ZPchr0010g7614 [Zizania palustris]|uniref:Uncharacterized protein n=1 Tax=Zizania palustris TaxID=103762 RepID=A0A8J5W7G2_ZIZPA|nr:hypothetical protein GUJ93_ZPchr0010g7614 [Zizania palustris]